MLSSFQFEFIDNSPRKWGPKSYKKLLLPRRVGESPISAEKSVLKRTCFLYFHYTLFIIRSQGLALFEAKLHRRGEARPFSVKVSPLRNGGVARQEAKPLFRRGFAPNNLANKKARENPRIFQKQLPVCQFGQTVI
jgi:hypothetical protein